MGANIAIVGAGYVGMPLARVFADAGKSVVLVDVNQELVDGINRGESHIGDVPSEVLKILVDTGHVSATSDYDVLKDVDAILIALPTRSHRAFARARSSSSSRRPTRGPRASPCNRFSSAAA